MNSSHGVNAFACRKLLRMVSMQQKTSVTRNALWVSALRVMVTFVLHDVFYYSKKTMPCRLFAAEAEAQLVLAGGVDGVLLQHTGAARAVAQAHHGTVDAEIGLVLLLQLVVVGL